MSDKIYVGSGKKAGNYDIVNISVCLTDLPKEHIFEYKGKKYIKLTVAGKKETDQFGKTHYVAVDTFKPEPKAEQPESIPHQPERKTGDGEDPLPF